MHVFKVKLMAVDWKIFSYKGVVIFNALYKEWLEFSKTLFNTPAENFKKKKKIVHHLDFSQKLRAPAGSSSCFL